MVSRYEGPNFRTHNDEIVSLWVAICPLKEIPENYFSENYEGEDDEPFNDFSNDFGFGYYDHDFVETICNEDWSEMAAADLIAKLSYSQSFLEAAQKAADDRGVTTTAYVLALYNFSYDPKVTLLESSKFMRFIGAFPFSSQEP
jgi:hypothetical protein